MKLRVTASKIAISNAKTGTRNQSQKKNDFEVLFENYFKIKIASAKKIKNCRQIIAAALM